MAGPGTHHRGASPRANECRHPLRWYIMTSGATDAETKRHFRDQGFFGLAESQVVFFQQGMLPAMSDAGRIVMSTPSTLAMAPDGNGGVYTALRSSGVLADMAAHGVEAIDCYCVDNALVRLGDPLFAGFCHERGVECGAWSVWGASSGRAPAWGEERVQWLVGRRPTCCRPTPAVHPPQPPTLPTPTHCPSPTPTPLSLHAPRRARGGQGLPRGEGGRVCAPQRAPGGGRVL